MPEVISTKSITSAPPAQVWQRLADFFGVASWAAAIDHSSAMTSTPAGMGASRRVALGSNVLIENIVDWKPGEAMAYEIDGLPSALARVENRWEIRPSADGGSEVSLSCSVEPGPKPPMKVVAKAVARRIASVNESLVADLVTTTERSA